MVDPAELVAAQDLNLPRSTTSGQPNDSVNIDVSKFQKQSQDLRIIESLTGSSSSANWKMKHDMDSMRIINSEKPERNFSKSNDGMPFLISNTNTSSGHLKVNKQDCQKKSSTSKWKSSCGENVVLDRFGRPMSVRPETMSVLKQLPDISFLSARTLLFNPEQRHIVQDLGAMINRKMPG